MTTKTVDDILDILDVGLQTSGESGFGTELNSSKCARCQRHEPPEGGDLCVGCRSFLLGDTEVDPGKAVRRTPPPPPVDRRHPPIDSFDLRFSDGSYVDPWTLSSVCVGFDRIDRGHPEVRGGVPRGHRVDLVVARCTTRNFQQYVSLGPYFPFPTMLKILTDADSRTPWLCSATDALEPISTVEVRLVPRYAHMTSVPAGSMSAVTILCVDYARVTHERAFKRRLRL